MATAPQTTSVTISARRVECVSLRRCGVAVAVLAVAVDQLAWVVPGPACSHLPLDVIDPPTRSQG